jgi:ribosomal protein S18 acetylase RimI-like enzyme
VKHDCANLVEVVDDSDVRDVLSWVLAPPGAARLASSSHTRSFLKYVSACRLEWKAYRATRERKTVAALYLLFLSGNSAILMPPDPTTRGVDRAALRSALESVLRHLDVRNLSYVQVLAEPEADQKQRLLRECGFRRLTRLVYLHRPSVVTDDGSPSPFSVSWIPYHEEKHDAFARVLEATYDGSLDCPELTPLRTIDDAIVAHKAAGKFDPSLWEIASVDGEHVGCVLISPLVGGSLAEIVYMGAAPKWRGRGVGRLLLNRAIELCARCGASEISVAVDERNAPARQLYARFGFSPTGERDAYIRVRKTNNGS